MTPLQREANLTSIIYRQSAMAFSALLVFALMAFWPHYIAQPFAKDIRFHVHALAMGTWFVLLITQPLLRVSATVS